MPGRNRRHFMSSLALGVASLSLATHSKTNRSMPNIIFILADDMGYGDIACQNPESKIPTPYLDRLASQGIRFTDAHSPSAVCTPTRYSLLTGRYCWRSRLKKSVLWPWDEPLIEPDRLTVADMLNEAGYSTACIGKWHLGWNWSTNNGASLNQPFALGDFSRDARYEAGKTIDFTRPIQGGPTERGFDYYFGDDVPNFPPYAFIENDRVTEDPAGEKPENMFGLPGPMVEGWNLENVMPAITKKAVEYIHAEPGASPFHKKTETPFFLYFSMTAPHTPIAPTKEFIGASQAGRYGDYVNQVDEAVGQIMRALKESGQDENTLLIFSSDNGSPARDGTDMNGDPRSVLRFGHNPSHIYRGIKTDIWEGGHRVPFMARWPSQIPENSLSDETICLVDFMSTCAALIGKSLPPQAAEDSHDISPALFQTQNKPIREATVHHSIHGVFAIRQGRWKLILGRGSGGWGDASKESAAPFQLYDLLEDPSETKNLYDSHPDRVRKLESLLNQYKTSGRSAPL